MLAKLLGGGLILSVLLNIGALWQRDRFRGQRDVARQEVVAIHVQLDAARIDVKAMTTAAETCAKIHAEQEARCASALDVANASAARARRLARACQSDEAVAARLGEVTR